MKHSFTKLSCSIIDECHRLDNRHSRSEEFGHHAAHRPATDRLNGRNVLVQQSAEVCVEALELVRTKSVQG